MQECPLSHQLEDLGEECTSWQKYMYLASSAYTIDTWAMDEVASNAFLLQEAAQRKSSARGMRLRVMYNRIALGERGASQPAHDGVTMRGRERLIE